MLISDTKVAMLRFGYPSDSPICPMLSIAVSAPPTPNTVTVNSSTMSTLTSACRISSPRGGGLSARTTLSIAVAGGVSAAAGDGFVAADSAGTSSASSSGGVFLNRAASSRRTMAKGARRAANTTAALTAYSARVNLNRFWRTMTTRSEGERHVQEAAERAVLAARRGRRARRAYDPDGAEEGDGDGGREPADEQDERLGVAASAAVEGEVELREDGAAEADESLEQAEHDAAALREVLDAGDERAGVGEGLRVGADGDIEADEPERGPGADMAGDGEVEHEVTPEIHGGADGEDEPWRRDLGDEAGVDADVGTDVLEEADGVELLLGVAEGGLDVLGMAKMYVAPAADMMRKEPYAMNHRPRSTCAAKAAAAAPAIAAVYQSSSLN
uniref:Uncharacterized protein n=1 Tax=Oryza meridionalis TaxID=40149 RepID=A0A0E0FEP2_9ORYZ